MTWSSCSATETVSLVEACRDVEVSLLMILTLRQLTSSISNMQLAFRIWLIWIMTLFLCSFLRLASVRKADQSCFLSCPLPFVIHYHSFVCHWTLVWALTISIKYQTIDFHNLCVCIKMSFVLFFICHLFVCCCGYHCCQNMGNFTWEKPWPGCGKPHGVESFLRR